MRLDDIPYCPMDDGDLAALLRILVLARKEGGTVSLNFYPWAEHTPKWNMGYCPHKDDSPALSAEAPHIEGCVNKLFGSITNARRLDARGTAE